MTCVSDFTCKYTIKQMDRPTYTGDPLDQENVAFKSMVYFNIKVKAGCGGFYTLVAIMKWCPLKQVSYHVVLKHPELSKASHILVGYHS